MKQWEYPFDADTLLRRQAGLRRQLAQEGGPFLEKKVGVLGGSTTSAIVDMLDLFLLGHGIKATFYQSEYGQYWQDAMFGQELRAFGPDILFIHTTSRNVAWYPTVKSTAGEIEERLAAQMEHFTSMWQTLRDTFGCPIIQNNFERPAYRLLGNRDVSDVHGHSNYIHRLNGAFYEYARQNSSFYIHDIDALAGEYGHSRWQDAAYWYRYKYALCMQAIPAFAYSLANVVKAIYGRSKKALVLDLDNTLWGGVVGDDGVEGLKLGPETPLGEAYTAFQHYIKAHEDLGVILTVCSKNEEENALAGLAHPDGVLKADDFAVIKANWENKDRNIAETAAVLNIGADSMVFVDDNPAERALVESQVAGIAVPPMEKVEQYITTLDGAGYFEPAAITGDDLHRAQMYKENARRASQSGQFASHGAFLQSLEMQAEIADFKPVYLQRITQLTNKSNQFNLTTRRYTESEMQALAQNPAYVRLYGKLADKFGDNGVVSVVVGRQEGGDVHLELWLMSCRVLKRDMEYAMLDALVEACRRRGVQTLYGYYHPTEKNGMVREFYAALGFEKQSEDEAGNTVWMYRVQGHAPRNTVIAVNTAQEGKP